MAEKKCVRLWVRTLVAIAVISAGSGAWAAGPCLNPGNTELPAGECVNLYGYDVKVLRGDSGLFPEYVYGDSVYKWSVSSVSGTTIYDVDYIDLMIPAKIATYGDLNKSNSIEVSISNCPIDYANSGSNPGTWHLYNAGLGDPTIPFGNLEHNQYVLKIIPGEPCPGITASGGPHDIKVTFKGKRLFSGLNEFLVKASPLESTKKKVKEPDPAAEALNLLGPSLISGSTTAGNQPPLRSVETFKLGDKNCVMEILLDQEESIAKASVYPFDVGPNGCTDEPITPESISKTFICDKDVSGAPINCKPKTFVEQSIMDKSGDDSTYCYYTKTGQRVCKTI